MKPVFNNLTSEYHGYRLAMKLIVLYLAITFVVPYLSFAFDGLNYLNAANQNGMAYQGQIVDIPKAYGRITRSFQGQDKLVICIQDLHCHYEVQKNIAAIIEHLADHYQLQLVGEEGASGHVDLDIVQSFPISSIRAEISDHLVKQGKLTGAEYASIVSQSNMTLVGIESQPLYDQSLSIVTDFLNAETQGYLYDLKDALTDHKQHIYTAELLTYDQICQEYELGKRDLLSYAQALSHMVKKNNGSLASFPNLKKYLQLNQLVFSSSTNSEQLYQELDQLDQMIRASLYTTKAQQQLDIYLDRVGIIEKLLNISVTQDELIGFRQNRHFYTARHFVDFIHSLKNDKYSAMSLDHEVIKLEHSLNQVDHFYTLADQRSQLFVHNLIDQMTAANQNLAVMVHGGFHTAHVLAELESKHIGYLVIKPQLAKTATINPYFAVLQGQKLPLEKLIEKNQTLLAPRSFPQQLQFQPVIWVSLGAIGRHLLEFLQPEKKKKMEVYLAGFGAYQMDPMSPEQAQELGLPSTDQAEIYLASIIDPLTGITKKLPVLLADKIMFDQAIQVLISSKGYGTYQTFGQLGLVVFPEAGWSPLHQVADMIHHREEEQGWYLEGIWKSPYVEIPAEMVKQFLSNPITFLTKVHMTEQAYHPWLRALGLMIIFLPLPAVMMTGAVLLAQTGEASLTITTLLAALAVIFKYGRQLWLWTESHWMTMHRWWNQLVPIAQLHKNAEAAQLLLEPPTLEEIRNLVQTNRLDEAIKAIEENVEWGLLIQKETNMQPLKKFPFFWLEKYKLESVFDLRRLRSLIIFNNEELRPIMRAALCLASGYYVKSGPDVSAIESPRSKNLKKINFRGMLEQRLDTASGAIIYSDANGKKAFVVKTSPIGIANELLGQAWFRFLGFTTSDVRYLPDRKIRVSDWEDNTVTLFEYWKMLLVDPDLFSPEACANYTLPDSFRQIIERAKLADIVIQLKDDHANNILLKLDTNDKLSPEPPIFIDRNNCFGLQLEAGTKNRLIQNKYRGSFGHEVIVSKIETGSTGRNENAYHQFAREDSLRLIALRIAEVKENQIVDLIEGVSREMGGDYPTDPKFQTDKLTRKWMEAINSVKQIYNISDDQAATAIPGAFKFWEYFEKYGMTRLWAGRIEGFTAALTYLLWFVSAGMSSGPPEWLTNIAPELYQLAVPALVIWFAFYLGHLIFGVYGKNPTTIKTRIEHALHATNLASWTSLMIPALVAGAMDMQWLAPLELTLGMVIIPAVLASSWLHGEKNAESNPFRGIISWLDNPDYQLPYQDLSSLTGKDFDPKSDLSRANTPALDPIIGLTIQGFASELFKTEHLINNLRFKHGSQLAFKSSGNELVLTMPSLLWQWAFDNKHPIGRVWVKAILKGLLVITNIKKRLGLEHDPALIALYALQAAPDAGDSVLARHHQDIIASAAFQAMNKKAHAASKAQFMDYLWSLIRDQQGEDLIKELTYLSSVTKLLGLRQSNIAIIVPAQEVGKKSLILYLPAEISRARRRIGAIEDRLREMQIPVRYKNWPNRQRKMNIMRSVLDAA